MRRLLLLAAPLLAAAAWPQPLGRSRFLGLTLAPLDPAHLSLDSLRQVLESATLSSEEAPSIRATVLLHDCCLLGTLFFANVTSFSESRQEWLRAGLGDCIGAAGLRVRLSAPSLTHRTMAERAARGTRSLLDVPLPVQPQHDLTLAFSVCGFGGSASGEVDERIAEAVHALNASSAGNESRLAKLITAGEAVPFASEVRLVKAPTAAAAAYIELRWEATKQGDDAVPARVLDVPARIEATLRSLGRPAPEWKAHTRLVAWAWRPPAPPPPEPRQHSADDAAQMRQLRLLLLFGVASVLAVGAASLVRHNGGLLRREKRVEVAEAADPADEEAPSLVLHNRRVSMRRTQSAPRPPRESSLLDTSSEQSPQSPEGAGSAAAWPPEATQPGLSGMGAF